MEPSTIKPLAKVINRWLSYQIMCGRSVLLSESYLAQPVAEFLIHHYSGHLETEFPHPVLNAPAPGRPKQVDFALLSRNTRAAITAVEVKWVAEYPYDKQAILNDLLRLECFRTDGRQVRRYFVVAGQWNHFSAHFLKLNVNVGGGQGRESFSKHFLSFSYSHPTKDIDCTGAAPRFQRFYRNFENAFRVEVPRGFRTTLLARTRADSIGACLWMVESRQNRSTFSPAQRGWIEG